MQGDVSLQHRHPGSSFNMQGHGDPSSPYALSCPENNISVYGPAVDLGMESSFAYWLQSNGLNQDTIYKMAVEGFTSPQVLAVMQTEDISAIGVTQWDQQILLGKLITKPRTAKSTYQDNLQYLQKPTAVKYLDIVDFVHVVNPDNSSEELDGPADVEVPRKYSQHRRKLEDTICKLYNRVSCPFGEQCIYRHVCLAPSCRQPHPLALHASKKGPVSVTKNLLRQD